MESASRLGTQMRSVAQQLEGARAAIAAGAPATDIATRVAGAVAVMEEAGRSAGTGGAAAGHGLLLVPGPFATPDIPVFLRAVAESSTAAASLGPIAGAGSSSSFAGARGGGAVGGMRSDSCAPPAASAITEAQLDAYGTALRELSARWPTMVARESAAVAAAAAGGGGDGAGGGASAGRGGASGVR